MLDPSGQPEFWASSTSGPQEVQETVIKVPQAKNFCRALIKIEWGKSATTFTSEGKWTEKACVRKSPGPSDLGTIWSSEDRKLSKRLTQHRFFRQTQVVTSSQAWELARAACAGSGSCNRKSAEKGNHLPLSLAMTAYFPWTPPLNHHPNQAEKAA